MSSSNRFTRFLGVAIATALQVHAFARCSLKEPLANISLCLALILIQDLTLDLSPTPYNQAADLVRILRKTWW
jgi:hypothetical protein